MPVIKAQILGKLILPSDQVHPLSTKLEFLPPGDWTVDPLEFLHPVDWIHRSFSSQGTGTPGFSPPRGSGPPGVSPPRGLDLLVKFFCLGRPDYAPG
jgi:hypothetical protein